MTEEIKCIESELCAAEVLVGQCQTLVSRFVENQRMLTRMIIHEPWTLLDEGKTADVTGQQQTQSWRGHGGNYRSRSRKSSQPPSFGRKDSPGKRAKLRF